MSKARMPQALRGQRCILHIDLDCFYCQVEQVRLGVPPGEPLAVQQWQNLIAINYSARKAGIQRNCTVEDALKKCPGIKLVHVATYSSATSEPQYYPNPSYSTHKVSLEPYRHASAKVFNIMERFCTKMQRASIDEGYVDVTEIVNAKLVERYSDIWAKMAETGDEDCPVEVKWEEIGVIIESKNDESEEEEKYKGKVSWDEVQLAVGAEISNSIRKAVYDELGFTCSAGISHNKMLSKLCSGLNKPNNQTIIHTRAVPGFMKTLPFDKIRGLGGKLGDSIEEKLDAQTAGDLWKYNEHELRSMFGSQTGTWLYNIVRGVDSDEVVSRNKAKSMMCAKSFRPPLHSHEQSQLNRWFSIVSAELYTRLMFDYDANRRWPKTLSLHYRCIYEPQAKSKSCPFLRKSECKSPDDILQKVLALFNSPDRKFPLVKFSISATGINSDGLVENGDIQQFFIRSIADKDVEGGGKCKNGEEDESEDENEEVEYAQDSEHEARTFKIKPELKAVDMHSSNSDTAASVEGNKFNIMVTKRQEMGIRRFFGDSVPNGIASANMAHNPSNIPSDVHDLDPSINECPHCHTLIPVGSVQEHKDFHFAMQLQQEERASIVSQSSSSTSTRLTVSTSKRSAGPKSLRNTEKKRRKEDFFQSWRTGSGGK